MKIKPLFFAYLLASIIILAIILKRKKRGVQLELLYNAVNKSFNSVLVSNERDVEVIRAIYNNFQQLGDGDEAKMSYIIATAFHESRFGEYMTEIGSNSYFDKYKAGTTLGNQLGNTEENDHIIYKGRGFVQITGRANYKKYQDILGLPLLNNPEIVANDFDIAAYIIVHGMVNGVFTGKKLSSYINSYKIDFYNARRTVNGTDKAELIKSYADKVFSFYKEELDNRQQA